jgi:hypothetical protein
MIQQVGFEQVFAALTALAILLYVIFARLSRLAKAALIVGSAAIVVGSLLAVPLVGLGIFVVTALYAAVDSRVRARREL